MVVRPAATLEQLGISFRGCKASDNLARAMQQVAPYAENLAVGREVRAFEDVSAALNDQTKISVLLHAVTKHLGKGTEAAIGAACSIFEALRLSVLYKDIVKDGDLTKKRRGCILLGGVAKKWENQASSFPPLLPFERKALSRCL